MGPSPTWALTSPCPAAGQGDRAAASSGAPALPPPHTSTSTDIRSVRGLDCSFFFEIPYIHMVLQGGKGRCLPRSMAKRACSRNPVSDPSLPLSLDSCSPVMKWDCRERGGRQAGEPPGGRTGPRGPHRYVIRSHRPENTFSYYKKSLKIRYKPPENTL
jgi:hypothetical protein